jgi:hypothetical protein
MLIINYLNEMMKKITLFILFVLVFCKIEAQHHISDMPGYADSVNSGLIPADTMKGSPHRVTMADIGDAHIHIEYGSPGVKGRIIWGGLVAMDQVWVAGAHNATTIQFSKPVIWGGNAIPAGKYGFFAIPGKEMWTVILNNKSDMHLADDYDEKEDVVRIQVKPGTLDKTVQRLTYIVKDEGNKKGAVIMQWDKLQVSIPVEIN